MANEWKRYKVTWNFTNRLCGSTPLQADMISGWLEARKPATKPAEARTMEEITKEAIDSVAVAEEEKVEKEERTTLGFQRNDDVLVMRGGTIRAHIKDCATVISGFAKDERAQGDRSFSVKAKNCIYIEDYWVPILKNGKTIKLSDGNFDKAVHAKSPKGPINALKRINYVERPTLIFHLLVLGVGDKEIITQKDLESIMLYGSIHGYAGERSDGEGRYTYKVEPVTH